MIYLIVIISYLLGFAAGIYFPHYWKKVKGA